MSKYRRVWVFETDHQVATVAMETTQLVLSQFKNFSTLLIENWIRSLSLSLPTVIRKCCELVKLCHINRSGFFETQCIFTPLGMVKVVTAEMYMVT